MLKMAQILIHQMKKHKNKQNKAQIYFGLLFNPDFKTMKKLVLSATLLLSVATFAQKDELKILKRMVNVESAPSQKDFDKYVEMNKNSILSRSNNEDKISHAVNSESEPNAMYWVSVKNKDVDTEKIYEKGFSTKPGNSGLGLWKVRQILIRNNNMNLFTTKNNEYFKRNIQKQTCYNSHTQYRIS